MATAAEIASPATYITDDVGVEVTDGNVSRVQLGKLASGSYGLRVVSSGGSTVIIDGTSDMFKIAATGTMSVAIPNTGVQTSTFVQLSALGALTSPPAGLVYLTNGTGPYVNINLAFWDAGTNWNPAWASSVSGGATNERGLLLIQYATAYTTLDTITNQAQVFMYAYCAPTGPAFTLYGRYYALQETAI